jgi:hypothetical protein
MKTPALAFFLLLLAGALAQAQTSVTRQGNGTTTVRTTRTDGSTRTTNYATDGSWKTTVSSSSSGQGTTQSYDSTGRRGACSSGQC